jgi:hypothetical protein
MERQELVDRGDGECGLEMDVRQLLRSPFDRLQAAHSRSQQAK